MTISSLLETKFVCLTFFEIDNFKNLLKCTISLWFSISVLLLYFQTGHIFETFQQDEKIQVFNAKLKIVNSGLQKITTQSSSEYEGIKSPKNLVNIILQGY